MFVVVQTLTKSSYFVSKPEWQKRFLFVCIFTINCIVKQGLNALVYKSQKQPQFSLVSNGAEVIMIDRKFYEDNCNQRLLTDLREQVRIASSCDVSSVHGVFCCCADLPVPDGRRAAGHAEAQRQLGAPLPRHLLTHSPLHQAQQR